MNHLPTGPLPTNPLTLRRGLTQYGEHVSYFHILGQADDHDQLEWGIEPGTEAVIVSDGAKTTTTLYPAHYDPMRDAWILLDVGHQYKDGKITAILPLPDPAAPGLKPLGIADMTAKEEEYPVVWTPDGLQHTFAAPGEAIQPTLF